MKTIPDKSILRSKNFAPERLLVPALFCVWMLSFITFSAPDDWRVSRFGTAPILPPIVLKLMKLAGRGGGIALLSFCLLGVWRHEKRGYVLAIMSPLLVFGFLGVSSTAWSALKIVSLQQSITFVLLLMLASYIGIAWRSDRDTERIVKHLGLMIFSLAVVLIALRLGMPRSGSLTKAAAGVMHSTNAGAAGGLGILLTLAARLLWRSSWSRWWFPIISVEVLMMLIGGNRLSVVVTAIAIIFLMALALNRAVAALLLIVMAVTFGGYLVADPGLSLVEQATKEVGVFAKQGQSKSQLGSLSGRAEMWEKMWKSYKKAPVFGHGYFVTTKKGRIYVWNEWGNWTAHNVVLQILVTTGLVGFLLMLFGFVMLVMGVFSGLKLLKGIEPSFTLLLVLAVWYFGWGFLNSSFIGPLQPEAVVFAACLGIAAGIGSSAHELADSRFSKFSVRQVPFG